MFAPEIFTMEIPQLSKSRTIRVWKPSDYAEDFSKRYPVIYMHDGQNLFDQQTAAYGEIWDVHTAIEDAMQAKGFQGAIVVGIDNAPGLERLDEYSPWICERLDDMKAMGEYQRDIGGDGMLYGNFIVETLKPYIDANYRTLTDRESTVIAGSSMGGFISLYLGVEHPDVFGKVGAFSTAAWFADQSLMSHLQKIDTSKSTKWYLDVGTNETSNKNIENFNEIYVQGTLALEQALISLGVPQTDLKVVVEEDAPHFETAWARRFPTALAWLFGL